MRKRTEDKTKDTWESSSSTSVDLSATDFPTRPVKNGIQKQNKIKGENHETDQKESEQGSNIVKHTTHPTTNPLDTPILTIWYNISLHEWSRDNVPWGTGTEPMHEFSPINTT